MTSFEEFIIGDEVTLQRTISPEDVDAFIQLTGDDNPLHVDADFAATTSLRKPVVHGMLSASFISTLIGQKLPGPGALWYELNIRFVSPVRVGETITVTAKVRHKTESMRLLALDISIAANNGTRVIEGEAKVQSIGSQPSSLGKSAALDVKKTEHMTSDIKTAPKSGMNAGAIIVTGGGGGIGSAICRVVAREGFAVVVNYNHNISNAEKVVAEIAANGGRAIAVGGDISDPNCAGRLVEAGQSTFGALAGIVNNAAPPLVQKPVIETSWAEIQHHLDVQVKGAFFLAQAALPVFSLNGGGAIVNLVSTVVDNIPPPGISAYAMAKSALLALSKSIALENGPANIRCNCVAPGMTNTDFIAGMPEKVKMLIKMQTPLRRIADPEDIAESVSFLLSDKSRHINGEMLRVCGGQVM